MASFRKMHLRIWLRLQQRNQVLLFLADTGTCNEPIEMVGYKQLRRQERFQLEPLDIYCLDFV